MKLPSERQLKIAECYLKYGRANAFETKDNPPNEIKTLKRCIQIVRKLKNEV